MSDLLKDSIEPRLKTVEWLSNQARLESKFSNELLEKLYQELLNFVNTGKLNNSSNSYIFSEKLKFTTKHPIAYGQDSLDPESTREGTMRPNNFVKHCIDILGKDIKTLDLGAGPAGLVYEWIFNGVSAIGIDGSDHCKKHNIGFWNYIEDSLFLADITKNFDLFFKDNNKKNVTFDIITMWEVLEHMPSNGMQKLFENIKKHMDCDGYFIGSISSLPYYSVSGKPYHLIVKDKMWWKKLFEYNGFEILEDHPFQYKMFCRGVGGHIQDQHNYLSSPNEGFHFVARLSGEFNIQKLNALLKDCEQTNTTCDVSNLECLLDTLDKKNSELIELTQRLEVSERDLIDRTQRLEISERDLIDRTQRLEIMDSKLTLLIKESFITPPSKKGG
jgi:2-polyprenyl-3-methyl-5-hydroxy-6-metoxy-1,4-benzoquinol methylase